MTRTRLYTSRRRRAKDLARFAYLDVAPTARHHSPASTRVRLSSFFVAFHPPTTRAYVRMHSDARATLYSPAPPLHYLTDSSLALAPATTLVHSYAMSAVAPRVAGTARRRLSRFPGPAGSGRDENKPPEPDMPASRRETDDKGAAKKRIPAGVPSLLLRRQELPLRRGGGVGSGGRTKGAAHHPPPSSLTASFASSEASTDSFCSRSSTGRIGRPAARRRAAGSAGPPAARPAATREAASVGPAGAGGVAAVAGSVHNGGAAASPSAPPRCPWVTPNTGR
jgi:hypothetical protein